MLALLAVCVFALPALPARAAEGLYLGEITRRFVESSTNIYAEMDKNSKVLKNVDPGFKITITGIYPQWVSIDLNGREAYVLRKRIDVLSTIDPVNTPPYPTMECAYYTEVDRTVDVKMAKDPGSDTLSTLTAGARISIVGMEDGWAKVIWCKSNNAMYGYLDSRELKEIYPVSRIPESAAPGEPISTFTSFYNNNPDRIVNLAVTGSYISGVVQPGERVDFNGHVAPFTAGRGYRLAPVLREEKTVSSYGGGSCQVSSTLWDTLVQLPGVTVLYRVAHGANGASYLPHGMDAASGTPTQNLIFRNDYPFPIRIEVSTHDLALFVIIYKESA